MADLVLTHNELKSYLREKGINLKSITRTRAVIDVELGDTKQHSFPFPLRFPGYLVQEGLTDDMKKAIQAWDLEEDFAQQFKQAHFCRRRIECIKILRHRFDLPLKVAKDFYEANEHIFNGLKKA